MDMYGKKAILPPDWVYAASLTQDDLQEEDSCEEVVNSLLAKLENL